MNEAPDYAEPFEAWRVWKVVRRNGEYMLSSVVHRTLWPPGAALTATCLRWHRLLSRLRRRRSHEAPEPECECGIYAAGLEGVGQYLAGGPCGAGAQVLGRVALWGTLIECERGFRASHAYPTHIYVPTDVGATWRVGWEDVAVGLWRYGVPVEVLPTASANADRVVAEAEARSATA